MRNRSETRSTNRPRGSAAVSSARPSRVRAVDQAREHGEATDPVGHDVMQHQHQTGVIVDETGDDDRPPQWS